MFDRMDRALYAEFKNLKWSGVEGKKLGKAGMRNVFIRLNMSATIYLTMFAAGPACYSVLAARIIPDLHEMVMRT